MKKWKVITIPTGFYLHVKMALTFDERVPDFSDILY
jgi:hypothetical protein